MKAASDHGNSTSTGSPFGRAVLAAREWDVKVSSALFDTMRRPLAEVMRGGFVRSGVGESSATEEMEHPGWPRGSRAS